MAQNDDSKHQDKDAASSGRDDKPQNGEPQNGTPQNGKNLLEWVVFAGGLLLVLSTVGFLGIQALRFDDSPPKLEMRFGAPIPVGKHIIVPVDVTNKGGTTAESVEVEVTHAKETAHFSLDMVPRQGKRRGWVSFDPPVRKASLHARVVGFQES